MTETSGHLPECSYTSGIWYSLDEPCICPSLRACEQRVLDAAREAVAALPAPYKVRGDFNTYGPYNEGRSDFKDSALTAIDALREEKP